jgi:hypothetical protein
VSFHPGAPGKGWLARDEQSDHPTLLLEEGDEDKLQQLQGHSITYRIAMGPQAGRKVLKLQTIPAREEEEYGTDQLVRIVGVSLHAGVSVNTREHKKLERICRGGPTGISLARRYHGREEPDQTAGKRKGMCCTPGHKAQRLKRVFNGTA